jgi:uncharacterized DUF497 family protein
LSVLFKLTLYIQCIIIGVSFWICGSKWDEKKNDKNVRKHGVEFDDAKTIWSDLNSIEFFDILHSVDEYRFVKIGYSDRRLLLTVVYSDRDNGNIIRIISARIATLKERHIYAR